MFAQYILAYLHTKLSKCILILWKVLMIITSITNDGPLHPSLHIWKWMSEQRRMSQLVFLKYFPGLSQWRETPYQELPRLYQTLYWQTRCGWRACENHLWECQPKVNHRICIHRGVISKSKSKGWLWSLWVYL